MAVPVSNITAARKNGLMLAAGFPNERTPFHDLRSGRRDARLEQRRGDAQSPEPDHARTRPVKRRLRSGRSLARALRRDFYECNDYTDQQSHQGIRDFRRAAGEVSFRPAGGK